MYPKCAGGRFFFATGSKSNTSRASLGSEIRLSSSRGAQAIGSGNLDSAELFCAKAAAPQWANIGLTARNSTKRRRVVAASMVGDLRPPAGNAGGDLGEVGGE